MSDKRILNVVMSKDSKNDWILTKNFFNNLKEPQEIFNMSTELNDDVIFKNHKNPASHVICCIMNHKNKKEYCEKTLCKKISSYPCCCKDVLKIANEEGLFQEIKEKEKTSVGEKIVSYAKIKDIDTLKYYITNFGPAMMSLPVFNDTLKFWHSHNDENKTLGGTVLLVTGYNPYGFVLKNVWDKKWGDNGITTFPYKDWNKIWDVWGVMNEEKKANVSPCCNII